MSNYSEKLKDPRWQKKRLEIFQRDDFTCQACRDKEKTLHVHHKYYLPGNDPWDYPEACLITLCEYCHQQEMENEGARVKFLNAFCDAGFLNFNFENCYEFVAKLQGKMSPREVSHLFECLTVDALREQILALLISDNPNTTEELEF